MIHHRHCLSDKWSTGHLYPLLELKQMYYCPAQFSTGQVTFEHYVLRGLVLGIQEIVESTLEYLEPMYDQLELID